MRALVAARVGVALVPRLTVEPGDTRVRAIPIVPSLPARQIYLAWLRSRGSSPAVRAFVAAAVESSQRTE